MAGSRHDLIVIGDGIAAYAAAIEGARLDLDVLLLPGERGGRAAPVLPTRLFLGLCARAVAAIRAVEWACGPASPPNLWGRLFERVGAFVETWASELAADVEASGLQVEWGASRLDEAGEVVLEAGARRSAPAIVVARRALPRRPARFPFDDRVVCDPTSALRSPARCLTVIGANEEGCELACLFRALGASVTLVDRRHTLLRSTDRDVLRLLHQSMQRAGIEVVLGEEVLELEVREHPREPHAWIRFASGREETCDRVVVCAGREPEPWDRRCGALALEADARGFVVVDERGGTSAAGVFAVGDVSGAPADVGAQIHHARGVAQRVAGLAPGAETPLPTVVYTIPEVASVGLTDEACQRLGVAFAVGVAPLRAAEAGDEGLLKLVVSAGTRRLLGIHAAGAGARDALQLGLVCLRADGPIDWLAEGIYESPGRSEAYQLAARAALARLGGVRPPPDAGRDPAEVGALPPSAF